MILENKFERYKGNERADKRIDEILKNHDQKSRILVLPEFIPCQKALSETDIAFVIFPSNRGGYCIQPQKKEYSMNYKCSFPESWLGLEGDELIKETGLDTAVFCHKGGFIMTVGQLDEAVMACQKAVDSYEENSVIVKYGKLISDDMSDEIDKNILDTAKMLGIKGARIVNADLMPVPDIEIMEDGQSQAYAKVSMEKQQWKAYVKEHVKKILKYKPEAVFVSGDVFYTYPVVRALRKKHIPVLTSMEKDGKKLIIKLP